MLLRVDVNLMEEMYCNAISEGNEEEWNFLWERYKYIKEEFEKSIIIRALACTKEVWL